MVKPNSGNSNLKRRTVGKSKKSATKKSSSKSFAAISKKSKSNKKSNSARTSSISISFSSSASKESKNGVSDSSQDISSLEEEKVDLLPPNIIKTNSVLKANLSLISEE